MISTDPNPPRSNSTSFLCTPDTPYDPNLTPRPAMITHTLAEEVGKQRSGWPSGDTILMRCSTCGAIWEEELPQ